MMNHITKNRIYVMQLLLVFSLLVGQSLITFADNDDQQPIVTGGVANALIVVPDIRTTTINEAANALVTYIKLATGADLSIVTVSQLDNMNVNAGTITIHIGKNSYVDTTELSAGLAGLHADGFIIYPDDDQLIITSPSLLGTLNGVYAFLEKYVGVTWLFPGEDWTDVPHIDELLMPSEMWRDEPTAFTLRRSMNLAGSSTKLYGDLRNQWLRQNRVNSANEIKIGHNVYRIFPVEKYGDTTTYPNFYPNNKPPSAGSHTGWQPCYSNPATVAVAVDYIKNYFDLNPQEISFSLAVNDSDGYCEMNANHPAYPGANMKINSVGRMHMSEIYYKWVNDVVAGVVADPNYADKWFAVYAYHAVIDPPAFDLHARVIPVITKDRLAWTDEDVETQGKLHFEQWRSKAEVLGWYDYTVSAVFPLPRVYPHYIAEQYEYALERDVRLHHWDMHPVLGDGPQPWVLSKLGWNMDVDIDALLDRWYTAAVGVDAAVDLQAYYELWETFWTTKVQNTPWFLTSKANSYLSIKNASYLSIAHPEIAQSRQLLESMMNKVNATGTLQQKARAEQILDQFEYYEASVLSSPVAVNKPTNNQQFIALLENMELTFEEKVYYANHRRDLLRAFEQNLALKLPSDPNKNIGVWSGWNAADFWYAEQYLRNCMTCGQSIAIKEKLDEYLYQLHKPKLREFALLLQEANADNNLVENGDFEAGLSTWNIWKPDGTANVQLATDQSISGNSLKFTNARQAGVHKTVKVKPGLFASSVTFFTPQHTKDGELQIVMELYAGTEKLIYYSELLRLEDTAGDWAQINFLEDFPAQIEGIDIDRVLINTQVRNAMNTAVYLDDIQVFQVQPSLEQIQLYMDSLIEDEILAEEDAQLLLDIFQNAVVHLAANEVSDYLSLLGDAREEVDRLFDIGSLGQFDYELIKTELQQVINEQISFRIMNDKLTISAMGNYQIPVSIQNNADEALTVRLVGQSADHINLSFASAASFAIPANSTVTKNGILIIDASILEGDYELSIILEVADKPIAQLPVTLHYNRNLLINGGFEQVNNNSEAVDWTGMNNGWLTGEVSLVSANADPDLVYSGNHALKLTRTATSGDARAKQQIAVQGGHKYELSAMMLLQQVSGAGKAQMKVEFYQDQVNAAGVKGEFHSPEYKTTMADWEQVKFQFDVPADANIMTIHLRVYGVGTVYYDDVELKRVS